MKRLENNVPYLSSSDRTINLKNKSLNIDSSCNIIKEISYKFSYKNKIANLRTYDNNNNNLFASENTYNVKKKCLNTIPTLKKLADCSNIIFTEKNYEYKPSIPTRSFANNTQEQYASDKTKNIKNLVIDNSNSCNIIKPIQDKLTFTSKQQLSQRAFESSNTFLTTSDRLKKLKNKCTEVTLNQSGSTTGIIQNTRDCSDTSITSDTISEKSAPYPVRTYESDVPTLDANQRQLL